MNLAKCLRRPAVAASVLTSSYSPILVLSEISEISDITEISELRYKIISQDKGDDIVPTLYKYYL